MWRWYTHVDLVLGSRDHPNLSSSPYPIHLSLSLSLIILCHGNVCTIEIKFEKKIKINKNA